MGKGSWFSISAIIVGIVAALVSYSFLATEQGNEQHQQQSTEVVQITPPLEVVLDTMAERGWNITITRGGNDEDGWTIMLWHEIYGPASTRQGKEDVSFVSLADAVYSAMYVVQDIEMNKEDK